MNLKENVFKNWNSLWRNYIIYTKDNFQKKWYKRTITKENEIRNFLIDLTYEINLINKNLLKSLFIFSQKKKILFLSNLIYEIDKKEFDNPLIIEYKKSTPIPIKNNNMKREFSVSSCFTPPNSFIDKNVWTKRQFCDLDDIISF